MAERMEECDDAAKGLVSIVVPVYNVSEYIERCILSIVKQTYGAIECIVVDDCTPDDSIVKAKAITDKYEGSILFVYVKHERNRGLSASRNTGTEVARGEYVYYLDSDDEISEDCIAKLYAETLKHPGVEIVQGNIRKEPSNVGFNYDISTYGLPDAIVGNDNVRNWYYRSGSRPVNAWNKLVLKSFIINNGLWFREGIIHEDHHWMFFVIRKLSHIRFVNVYVYIHYIRPNSIMTSGNLEKSAKHVSVIALDFLNNLDAQYHRKQYDYVIRFLTYWYARYASKFHYPEIYSRLWSVSFSHKYFREMKTLLKFFVKRVWFLCQIKE